MPSPSYHFHLLPVDAIYSNSILEKYQTVTIETYHGGIVDENMVNSGDRLKVKRAVSDYETRTVDNKYGAGHDVTAISVKDAFTTVGSDLLNADTYAWIDDSGTTEMLECGRRGVCDRSSGTCDCAEGYMGVACGIQTSAVA